jgi:putative transposase
LKRKQRSLSRKNNDYISKKETDNNTYITHKNIDKQIIELQRIYYRLKNIRIDFINQVIDYLIKFKPKYITIEDLDVSKMLSNKRTAHKISKLDFFLFRKKLTEKCRQHSIELRVVDKYFPSSKICSQCSKININLKSFDYIFKCECGFECDRDYNASLNLKNASVYKVLA